jgi:hypothetical protein
MANQGSVAFRHGVRFVLGGRKSKLKPGEIMLCWPPEHENDYCAAVLDMAEGWPGDWRPPRKFTAAFIAGMTDLQDAIAFVGAHVAGLRQ